MSLLYEKIIQAIILITHNLSILRLFHITAVKQLPRKKISVALFNFYVYIVYSLYKHHITYVEEKKTVGYHCYMDGVNGTF